jgi:hypothetical protein
MGKPVLPREKRKPGDDADESIQQRSEDQSPEYCYAFINGFRRLAGRHFVRSNDWFCVFAIHVALECG